MNISRILSNATIEIHLEYKYAGKVTKLRFDFKNRNIGVRWHLITVRKTFYERFLTSQWIEDGQELIYIYLSNSDYLHLTLTNDLSVFDNQLDLTSFDSLGEQII